MDQTLTLDLPDGRSPTPEPEDSSLYRGSPSRLNAGAPEFVPRSPSPSALQQPRMVKIQHGRAPPPLVHHVFHPPPPYLSPPPPGQSSYEYFGPGGGGGGGGFVDQAVQSQADLDPGSVESPVEGLSEEVTHKVTRQVEYYFSDINLATTELLMRFISKDPDGYVPMSVVASFKKVKTLVQNFALLATALRTSSKLVVSEDGKKVRRQQPFTDSDLEELQSRIVVAENLPEDHCYQSLKRIFSSAGRVKTIRTCYPQTPNVTATATNKSTKMDMLFGNRLHAFVEYETLEDAERAVTELNDGRNWRSGLRVRSLHHCMTRHGPVRGRKGAYDGDGNEEEDASTSNQPIEKLIDDPSQLSETSADHMGEENLGDRRGRGRGRGARGRGRGQYHNSRGNGGSVIGATTPGHHTDQTGVAKQPPGPRMPDGTRGFNVGRGKPLNSGTGTGTGTAA